MALRGSTADPEEYVALMTKLIGESKFLQNSPSLGLHAEETRVTKIVLDVLGPYTTENGGPLEVKLLEYVKGRANLKIIYKGTSDNTKADSTISFVGSHMDVVPANPADWTKDPFTLTREGDKLFGRGTTDCLGHVALLTLLLKHLGETKPVLKRSVVVLFIAAEESSSEEVGVGVDGCLAKGEMEISKNGPMFWIDSADGQPCRGTAGMASWDLEVSGRLFHSGFPHMGINSIELAMRAYEELNKAFHEKFPAHPEEERYGYPNCSSMKVTQVHSAPNSVNQIPPKVTLSGDIRLTPFYELGDCVDFVTAKVKEISESVEKLQQFTPASKFVLPEDIPAEVRRGSMSIRFPERQALMMMEGVAVDLDSKAHKTLCAATEEVFGSVKATALTGSLPVVRSMKNQGFDVQIAGYGLSQVYHGVDEYCELSTMMKAFTLFTILVADLD